MRNLKPAIIAIYLTVLSLPASCGTVPAKLSVQDAIRIALDTNVNLKQSEYARLSALSNYRKERILTSYGMTAETDLSHVPGVGSMAGLVGSTASYNTLFGSTAQLTFSPFGVGTGQAALGISITRPLMRGSGFLADRYNQLLNAQSTLLVQEKLEQSTQRTTILNVINAYYQAVLAKAQVDIQLSAVKSAQDSADFLQRKVDAGFEAGIGLTQANVAVMQAKESLNGARQAAQSAMDTLMIAMGIGVGQSPQLVDDVPDYNPPLPDLNKAIETAMENRAEVTQINESVAQQRRAVAQANDHLRSDLGLVASWNSSMLNPGLLGPSLFNLGTTFFGIKLSVPLDQRTLREDRNTSARTLDLLEREQGFEHEQIADNVRNAYHAVETARASVANLSENEKVVDLQVYQARRMLEEGLGTTFDLVKAQNDQATFNVQIKTARVNLYLAHLQLKLSMGEAVIPMAPIMNVAVENNVAIAGRGETK